MSYSTLYVKKSRKTLAALAGASFLSLLIGTFFFVNQLGRQNGWQKTTGIDKLYIVNRTAHGFDVVWSTHKQVHEEQWVEVGTEKGNYPVTAKLETIGGVYHTTIDGLHPDTTYYFRVRLGAKTYILPSLIPESVHTPKAVKEKPISPAYGKVILPSTRPYMNGLLIYEIDGYYPLAVFTKETGEWLLPLTGLIEKKSNSILSLSDSTPVSIKLFSYPDGIIRTVVGQTRPLKQAITAGASLHLAQTAQEKGESVLGVSSQNTSSQSRTLSSIIYPKENALIPGNAPLIRGMAPGGKAVTVLIQGGTKQYSYRTQADEKGEWVIQYPLVLAPGRYTIVATIENSSGGTANTVKRTFSIIKSGEQVLGVATGTPTLIPTAPIVPTYANPTPTLGVSGVPTPTHIVSPTVIIPTRFVPTATPPITGGGMSGFLFGALFCIVIGTGLVLAF